jgi:hypothetical protein
MPRILSRMRSPTTSRSNCAKDNKTFRVRRPIEVVVLNCCVTETKDAPLASRIYDLGKIGERAGQPVDLGDDQVSTRPATISSSNCCSAGRSPAHRSGCTRPPAHAKKPGTRPMCPRNPLSDHGQRAIALSVVFKAVLAYEDGMGVPAPLPNQGRTGLQHDARKEGTSAFLELSCQDLEAALQRPAQAAIGALLQLIGEPPDHQIATEPLRRFSAMKLAPGDAQVMRRSINHLGNLAIYLGAVCTARSVVRVAAPSETGRRPARARASRRIVGWRGHALAGSMR